nr:MAG TPA: hypothetical protein [Caudoviricetes sp.]
MGLRSSAHFLLHYMIQKILTESSARGFARRRAPQ